MDAQRQLGTADRRAAYFIESVQTMIDQRFVP
jgi:hypothetical protein